MRRQPVRPFFHVAGLVTRGTGRHAVDFRAEALSEGSVFWLRPGQVHHVLAASDLHGVLLLFTGAALAPGTPVAPLVAAAPAVPGPASAVFQRFAAAVEADHARRHHVRDYEQAVHASARTIDRAVRRARGMSAKRFVLEARRLATTDTTVAALAAQLGFTEATNFVKFHRRLTSTTPRAA
ncbi:helix-turn-helix transcriptional regulator [Amycolatopsis sp. ATCC 39116]|uniref:AraC family transcriptional regulator n=1 Tax=Amycolatopsis sp. (strain ATCC 39116 / 75iv2) TaxID=385957 RepID=UPI0002627681|nr:helix-turn-helix transcriptional regulator [Amycolatopsis sp. ATCC 39116]